jgi:hypothetical protein
VSIVTVSNTKAAGYLSGTYHWPLWQSAQALATARQISPSPNNRPTDDGYVTIIWDGTDFVIEDRHR